MFEIKEKIEEETLEYAKKIIFENPNKAYAITQRQNVGDREKVACLLIEAEALWHLSKFKEAIRVAEKIKEKMAKNERSYSYLYADSLIGNVYQDLGNREKALEYYTKSLPAAMELSDKKMAIKLMNNIGRIYVAYGAFDEAMACYKKSLAMAKESNDISLMAIITINIADLKLASEDIDGIENDIKGYLEDSRYAKDYLVISKVHIFLARLLKRKKLFDQAKQALEKAEKSIEEMGTEYLLIELYIEMIQILNEEKSNKEALNYAQKALTLTKKLSMYEKIAEVALLLAYIYERIGDVPEVLKCYKIYSEANEAYENEQLDVQKRLVTTQLGIERSIQEKERYKKYMAELKEKSEKIAEFHENIRIIGAIGQDITSTLALKESIQLLYGNISKLMDTTYFAVIHYNAITGELISRFVLESGEMTQVVETHAGTIKSIVSKCAKCREAKMINNYSSKTYKQEMIKYERYMSIEKTSRSLMFIPLIIQEELIGLITVQSKRKQAYTEYHFNMLKALATYVAIAIKNAQKSEYLSIEMKKREESQQRLNRLNDKLSKLTYIDELTNIPNRRKFVRHINHEIIRARRKKEMLGLLIVDIDYFKEYNDHYGHLEGDKCIEMVAATLEISIEREIDFVARYGGDEFILVLPNTDKKGLRKVAEKIRNRFEKVHQPHAHSKAADYVTVSIGGVAQIPKNKCTMEKLLHYADEALYVAKSKGRNQYTVH